MSSDSSAASSLASEGQTSRRRLLAFLGAGGVAAFTGLFTRNEARAGHDGTNVMHLGEENFPPVGSVTSIQGRVDTGPTLIIDNNLAGDGLAVQSGTGIGVFGSSGPGPGVSEVDGFGFGGAFLGTSGGVLGESVGNPGVRGASDQGTGGWFTSSSGNGVVGEAHQGGVGVEGVSNFPNLDPEGGKGVQGVSTTKPGGMPEPDGPGVGVQGLSGTGIGVDGNSQSGIGVRARSAEGLALSVEGKSMFSTAGSAVIPGGESLFVPNPAVTDESHITVTLTGNPGMSQVSWVERDPGSGFSVHFAPPLRRGSGASLTYLIVEPA